MISGPIADKNLQEEVIKQQCKVEWTIVKPGGLNNNASKKNYKFVEAGIAGGSISRADVAHFILDKCISNDPAFANKMFSIVNN